MATVMRMTKSWGNEGKHNGDSGGGKWGEARMERRERGLSGNFCVFCYITPIQKYLYSVNRYSLMRLPNHRQIG